MFKTAFLATATVVLVAGPAMAGPSDDGAKQVRYPRIHFRQKAHPHTSSDGKKLELWDRLSHKKSDEGAMLNSPKSRLPGVARHPKTGEEPARSHPKAIALPNSGKAGMREIINP